MTNFTELVLAALQFQGEGLLTIADILLSSPRRTRRWFHRIPTEEQRWFKENWADRYRNRQQFYRTLNHLKQQGLVAAKKEEDTCSWILTPQGKERNEQYQQSRRDPLSSSAATFEKPTGAGLTIVAYDIPENERRKRAWVRMCLAGMGGEKIQKSVWIMKGMIDPSFIHALRQRNLLPHIHIFAVTKQGTIQRSVS